MATHSEVTQFACSGIQAVGIETVQSAIRDVLREAKAKHVVSVGAGYGIVEAALQLPDDVQIWAIDPAPQSFILSKPVPEWVPVLSPAYPTIDELIQDQTTWARMDEAGIVLLLIWPPSSNNTGYDIDAIVRLRPKGIVIVSDPTGFSGSRDLNVWLQILRDSCGGAFPYTTWLSAAEVIPEDVSESVLATGKQYTLTHDIRRPGYLAPLPKGTLEIARQKNEIRELDVDTTLGESLGIVWEGRTKVIKDVIVGSALALCGGSDLAGWRLTLVNGTCPKFPHDVDEMARAATTFKMIFIKDPVIAMVFTCVAAVRTDLQISAPPKYERRDGVLTSWPL